MEALTPVASKSAGVARRPAPWPEAGRALRAARGDNESGRQNIRRSGGWPAIRENTKPEWKAYSANWRPPIIWNGEGQALLAASIPVRELLFG